MFNCLKICILSGFSGFPKLSGEVISKRIEQGNGQILSIDEVKKNPEVLDCLIVPELSSLEKILTTLGLDFLPNCKVLTQSWATNSLKSKTLLPYSSYFWSPPSTLPQKRPSESPCSVSPDPSPKNSLRSHFFPETLSPEKNRTVQNSMLVEETHTLNKDLLTNINKFTFSRPQHNLNSHLTSVLEILMNNYTLLKDKGRAFAYRFAITSLQSHPEKIVSLSQIKDLEKIGAKIKKKIAEILETGTLKRVESMESISRLKALKEFNKIWGVGASTADRLFSLGYRSISDLKRNVPSLLNENQRIGLELYDDLSQKIPREEVKEISEIVVNHAKILLEGVDFEANTCGSYRRGREMCGDVDVLITFDHAESNKGFLNDLIEALKKIGLVTHTLVLSLDNSKHENFTFEGIAKLPNKPHRRLDVKIYPRKFYAWALMHFTGSQNFNRSIRHFAKTKGLKLTDEGLFPAIRSHGETHCGPNLAVCYTEEEIFRLFGMPFKPPEQRDI